MSVQTTGEGFSLQSTPKALYTGLLGAWCDGMLKLQAPEGRWPSLSGGLWCPSCACIHGRCADAIYPLLHQARETGDVRYLDAAVRLQAWSDHVTLPDGSWLNDSLGHEWRGITVFGAMALGEALRHHGDLLDAPVRTRWRERLQRAVAFLDGFMTMEMGNINYPISCAATFAIAAEVLEEPRYLERARAFAHDSLAYFTENGLIFGEGHPHAGTTPRGCRAVDLGYNVEESLPSLALYARLSGDAEVLAVVTAALRRHLEFLLPDGGWDNSWGTRNYKWTYWGSRTSDGCQPGLLLLADQDPRFAEAALRNTRLLAACTHDGILYGGPHYRAHGELPCSHHTFCHAKALAAALDLGVPEATTVALPRETAQGVTAFPEVATWLLACGPWRGTVTAYDWDYTPEGHASGGTLSLLWHPRVGPLVTAAMTQYTSTAEPTNMQPARGGLLSLTPQAVLEVDGIRYRSANDFTAQVTVTEHQEEIAVAVAAQLVDRAHQAPAGGTASVHLDYRFTPEVVTLTIRTATPGVYFDLPLVSVNTEPVAISADGTVTIDKPGGRVVVRSTQPPTLAGDGARAFSPVPGFETVPLRYALPPGQAVEVRVSVM